MDIANGRNIYQVGNAAAEADGYRLYLCVQEETGRQCLLQIASDVGQNGKLDRAAYVLRELKQRADEIEKEYAIAKPEAKDPLNYDLGFPELVDSFICPEQGSRRINILAFRSVKEVASMVPLTNITDKDHRRVDLRTSAWIMGKLLKLLVFTQSEGISVGLTTGNNILIEPENRYALFFDWSDAQMFPEGIPTETRCQEISQVAQAVITVLGGDLEKNAFPDDGEKAFGRYTEFLLRLARGSERDAQRAHANFYEIVDLFWKREFYPFTIKPLAE